MLNGCEWIIEAHGCNEAALSNSVKLHALFDHLINAMDLHPVAQSTWHQFPVTGGITGLSLLSESHIACHTFPEFRSLCLNVFCCRPRPESDFEHYLRKEFDAVSVQIRRLERPYSAA
jgi:S-adenosylmethionine decarboxylase